MENNYLWIELCNPSNGGMQFNFTSANNLIIGKNGAGKTLLLDSIFYAITGKWVGHYIYPVNKQNPFFLSKLSIDDAVQYHQYNRQTALWKPIKDKDIDVGTRPVLYCKNNNFIVKTLSQSVREEERFFSITNDNLWWGKLKIVEGLLTDWTTWEAEDKRKFFKRDLRKTLTDWTVWEIEDKGSKFNIFVRMMNLFALNPGDSIRVVNDTKLLPTLRCTYGDVPLVNLPSGVKRIIELLYAIAWFRFEHCLEGEAGLVMIDDLENSLDLAYQDMLVCALPRLQELLECKLQIIATTRNSNLPSSFKKEAFALFHL